MSQVPRKEFPFSLAVLVAIMLHLAVGSVLRHHAVLMAAMPVIPSSAPLPPPPLSVRFVEVPPDSPSVEEVPDTPYYSDANRKADPSPPKASRRAFPPENPGSERTASSPPPQARAGADDESSPGKEMASLPPRSSGSAVQMPGTESAKNEGVSPGLTDSLQNLDRYLPSTGNSWGDVPQVDSGSGVFFDTKGHDLGPWANRVIAMVRSNWIVPVAASLGMKGAVGVSFEVDRSGRVLTPQLVSSSGIVSFDQAAINAIRSSDPMPPLPDYFPLPRLSAVFRFYYNMAVPD